VRASVERLSCQPHAPCVSRRPTYIRPTSFAIRMVRRLALLAVLPSTAIRRAQTRGDATASALLSHGTMVLPSLARPTSRASLPLFCAKVDTSSWGAVVRARAALCMERALSNEKHFACELRRMKWFYPLMILILGTYQRTTQGAFRTLLVTTEHRCNWYTYFVVVQVKQFIVGFISS